MHQYQPTTEVTVFLVSFFLLYMFLLTKRVVHKKVDLYDFFMLATLGVIPLGFVLFPSLVTRLAQIVGVEFPFLILFGALSAISFFMVYRLIRRTNKLRRDVILLTQHVGILRTRIDSNASREGVDQTQ